MCVVTDCVQGTMVKLEVLITHMNYALHVLIHVVMHTCICTMHNVHVGTLI